jgi:hypothetical protein
MAQIFGVAPASTMSLTPFSGINVSMKLEKTCSLRQAKIQSLTDRIKEIAPEKFSLTIIDKAYRTNDEYYTPEHEQRYLEDMQKYPNALVFVNSPFLQPDR